MTDTITGASQGEASRTAPDSPATCKFKKVRLAGLPPRKSAVEALMKSLAERGVLGPHKDGHAVSRRASETAESRPQAVAESDALGTVVAFSRHRKASRYK
jgi:hypothetical protein